MPDYKKILLTVACLLAISACQSNRQPGVPAVLEPPAKAQKVHPLNGAVSYLLNNAKVTLADNAFYESSEVIIEGKLLGRTFDKPNHFRLWLVDGNCLLEHVESRQRLRIFGMSCRAE